MMESENILLEEALVCTLIASTTAVIEEKNREKKKKKRIWVREFLQKRDKHGAHVVTVNALRTNDPYSFRRYIRISGEVYEVHIFFTINYIIKKQYPFWCSTKRDVLYFPLGIA